MGPGGTLFVADTVANRITAIPAAATRQTSAGTGRTITSGGALSGPLGMAIVPNGDVLTVNGGNGKIVETTPGGQQIATRFLDRSGSPPGSGALFGLAVAPAASGVYYVDDAVNTLRLLHLRRHHSRCGGACERALRNGQAGHSRARRPAAAENRHLRQRASSWEAKSRVVAGPYEHRGQPCCPSGSR